MYFGALQTDASEWTKEREQDKDEVIFLLRKEIVSALESLKGVQIQMSDLLSEKEEILKAEREGKKTVDGIKSQVIELETKMSSLENMAEDDMIKMANKLYHLEEHQQKLIEVKL